VTPLDSFSGAEGLKVIPIPAGTYPAEKTCTAVDADLIAANIKDGVTIFGVEGSIDVTPLDSFSGADGLKVIPIPAGTYPAGKTATAQDADLVAANIKDGVTIFGVEGSLEAGGGREQRLHPVNATDDGYIAYGASFYDTRAYLYLGAYSGIDRESYIRMPDVDIKPGSTILTAVLKIAAYSAQTVDTCKIKIHFNDVDDATQPTTYDEFIALALDTGVAWADAGHWVQNAWYTLPSVLVPLQAIIDREGWAQGNAIMLVLKNDGSDLNARRVPHSLESLYGSYQAELYVTWTEPAA